MRRSNDAFIIERHPCKDNKFYVAFKFFDVKYGLHRNVSFQYQKIRKQTSERIDIVYRNFYSRLKEQEKMDMSFFNRSGKKKGKTNRIEEMEPLSSQKDGREAIPTPEGQYTSENKNGDMINGGSGNPNDEDGQEDPIIINGEDYLLHITGTRTEALITLYRPFSLEELHALLEENGIVYGVREETLEKLAQVGQSYTEILIASGTAAQSGSDGYFEYHFNPEPQRKPIILPDGTVDYNVLGEIELVTDGQHLATYHSAVPGEAGIDVLGNPIEAYNGKELPPLKCKRCAPDETGYEYYASAEGNVTVEDGSLTVTPLFVIKGNLDANTGDVDFHGDVLIQGNVSAGVTVKTTGDITINGHVETASLYAGNDVILKNGMQGSGSGVIHAGGNVMARFLEQIQVFAGNEINVGALLNCEVEAGKSVIISGNRGTIIGGSVKAVEQITSASIGNRAAVTTRLVIGLDFDFRHRMEDIDCKIENYQEKIEDATQELENIADQLKTKSADLGLIQQKTEQMRRKINYQLKLKEISMERERLINIYQRSANGKIIVSGTANAGCVIVINGLQQVLQSEFRNVTIKRVKKEIWITSNKLSRR